MNSFQDNENWNTNKNIFNEENTELNNIENQLIQESKCPPLIRKYQSILESIKEEDKQIILDENELSSSEDDETSFNIKKTENDKKCVINLKSEEEKDDIKNLTHFPCFRINIIKKKLSNFAIHKDFSKQISLNIIKNLKQDFRNEIRRNILSFTTINDCNPSLKNKGLSHYDNKVTQNNFQILGLKEGVGRNKLIDSQRKQKSEQNLNFNQKSIRDCKLGVNNIVRKNSTLIINSESSKKTCIHYLGSLNSELRGISSSSRNLPHPSLVKENENNKKTNNQNNDDNTKNNISTFESISKGILKSYFFKKMHPPTNINSYQLNNISENFWDKQNSVMIGRRELYNTHINNYWSLKAK